MIEVARQFRKLPTPSEALLWQSLRRRQLDGRKLRHQVPIGAFVVNFFCWSEQLVVEVDGSIHELQQGADAERQALIESIGVRFIRVSATQVETDLTTVLNQIRAAFKTP